MDPKTSENHSAESGIGTVARPRAGFRAPGRSDPDDVTIINPLCYLSGDRHAADQGEPEPPKHPEGPSPIVGKF